LSIFSLFIIFNLFFRKKLLISAFSEMCLLTFWLMTLVLFDEWNWVVVLSDALNNKCNCFVVFGYFRRVFPYFVRRVISWHVGIVSWQTIVTISTNLSMRLQRKPRIW
jgi:hypothetical protein